MNPRTVAWFKRSALVALLVAFCAILVRTAWLCDDAYISLRVVDNAVSGHGLRWNVVERVQGFTHPLWVLVLTPACALTKELYLTVLLISMALSLTAVGLAVTRLAGSFWARSTGLLLLAISPPFVDYCSSGLENPLSHLLLVVFLLVYWRDDAGPRRLFWLAFVAALALATRLDHLWLYAPPLAYALLRRRSKRAVVAMLLGAAPLILWCAFALAYYGSLVPNSGPAKLGTGLGLGTYLGQGLRYFADAGLRAPLTALLLLWSLVAGIRAHRNEDRVLSLGILLYLLWVCVVGGDFMRGRFLSLPLLLGVALLMRHGFWLRGRARWAVAPLALCLALLLAEPTFLSGSGFGQHVTADVAKRHHGITDERRYYYQRYGLLNGQPLGEKPGHDMAGLRRLQSALTSKLLIVNTAGENGFIAGAQPYVIDTFALNDPLLARLEMDVGADWRIGHFPRRIPAGYSLSALTGTNRFESREIGQYYEKLLLITRGPVFSRERWREIVRMHSGRYRHLVRGGLRYRAEDASDCVELALAVPDLGHPELLWAATRHLLLQRDYARAEPIFARLLAIRPGDTQQVIDLAYEYVESGRGEEVADLLRFLLRVDPDCAEALHNLGGIYFYAGREREGLELMAAAARLGHAEAKRFLAANAGAAD